MHLVSRLGTGKRAACGERIAPVDGTSDLARVDCANCRRLVVVELPVRTVPPELLPLALDIQEARVRAEAEGSLRMRMTNVRTDERKPEERRVR